MSAAISSGGSPHLLHNVVTEPTEIGRGDDVGDS